MALTGAPNGDGFSGKVVGVVQARLGSTRLPGKVLLPLADTTVIGYMLQRLRMARTLTKIVVAVPVGEQALIEEVRRHGCDVFEGSEGDVLDRVYKAANAAAADYVVRFTGDCPLVDPVLIDDMVNMTLARDADYLGFGMNPTFPDGLGTEVIRFRALAEAWKKAVEPMEREHVTWYIRTRQHRFHLEDFLNDVDQGRYRFTLDDPEDLSVIRAIVGHFEEEGRRDYSFREVVEAIDAGVCGRASPSVRDQNGPNPIHYT